MLKKIKNYIMENNFEVKYTNKKVNIINYISISHFAENKIIIRYKSGILKIEGKNLTIIKLLKDETLITGIIERINIDEK